MKSWDFTPKERPPRKSSQTVILVIIVLFLVSLLAIMLAKRYM